MPATYTYPNNAPVRPFSAMNYLVNTGWPDNSAGGSIQLANQGVRYISPYLCKLAALSGGADIDLSGNDLDEANITDIINEILATSVTGGVLRLVGGTNSVPAPDFPPVNGVVTFTCPAYDGIVADPMTLDIELSNASFLTVSIGTTTGDIIISGTETAEQIAELVVLFYGTTNVHRFSRVGATVTVEVFYKLTDDPSPNTMLPLLSVTPIFDATIVAAGEQYTSNTGISNLLTNSWTVTWNEPDPTINDPLLGKENPAESNEDLWSDADKNAAVAAQLATDTAAVEAKKDKIEVGTTILGVAGELPASSGSGRTVRSRSHLPHL